MYEKTLSEFQSVYGSRPHYLIRAPGRANLIGEHTDYNDGFVMPLAVSQALWMAISPRADHNIRVYSMDFENVVSSFSLSQLQDDSLPHWTQHVRGGWWLMGQKGFKLPGADVVLGGNIPLGVGMSSSAAIGVAVVEAALALTGDAPYSQIEKALMAVEIEHEFMHVPCGVMDQITSAAAQDGAAMLLDCRSLETTPVNIPESVLVLVMNTAKSRELASSAYAERRRQCEEAAQLMGIPALRDATLGTVEEHRGELGDIRYRRARHIVTEDERTLAMQVALEENDLERAGELLNDSHASLREDYEVSCRELDVMSKLARSHPACYGARMMGGGFGGCAVGLVRADAADEVISAVGPDYADLTGLSPEFYICIPSAGSSVERLAD